MKPAWDQLMKEWNAGPRAGTSLVADVDCTADGGKDLCEEHGVQGFPTIKWGDPSALEDYEGGRGLEELKAFAEENLKPMCSPKNMDLCDDEKKQAIQELLTMSLEALREKVDDGKKAIKDAESIFEKGVEKLQEQYDQLSKEKDAAVAKVKTDGLSLATSVLKMKEAEQQKDEL